DPPFVALLSNGTSGDINNIDFRKKRPAQGPYDQVHVVANAVAAEALKVCHSINYVDWVPLGVRQTELKLGVRRPDAAEVARAEGVMAGAKKGKEKTMQQIYAHEALLLRDSPAEVSIIIQALRIGDLGIATVPCEVFVEIGLEIKSKSPFKPTFTIELANGCSGYLPTPEQHKLGGYETWPARSSYLEVDAAPKIVAAVMDLFSQLK